MFTKAPMSPPYLALGPVIILEAAIRSSLIEDIIRAFTAAVIGGIGNIRGAFFGGISLGLVEIYASAVIGTQWKPVTVFIILILILLFKPNGIFGEAVQRTRV